jgi:glyoxylase-like metal-dependent hydrolase (beta-lactamase superfamily II)
MKWVEVAPGILQLPARPRSHARSHAYLLESAAGLLLVEPAHSDSETEEWIAIVRDRKPRAIVLTHHHLDHTYGIERIQEATKIDVWSPPRGTPTEYTPHQQYEITRELGESDDLGGWSVLRTPGHEDEHLVLYRAGVLISGDAMKPGLGSPDEFLASMKRIMALDPEIVFPAHGLSMRRTP